jgi:hypothetical protein
MKGKRTKSQTNTENCFPEINDKFTLGYFLNWRHSFFEIDIDLAFACFPFALQINLHAADPDVKRILAEVREAIVTYTLAAPGESFKTAASELNKKLAAFRKDLNERTANHLLKELKEEFDEGDFLALHSAIMLCNDYEVRYPEWLSSHMAEASRRFLEEEDASMLVGDRSKGGRHANPHVKKKEKETDRNTNAALFIAREAGLKGDKRISNAQKILEVIGWGQGFEKVRRSKADQADEYHIWKLLIEFEYRYTLKRMDATGIPRPDSTGIKYS